MASAGGTRASRGAGAWSLLALLPLLGSGLPASGCFLLEGRRGRDPASPTRDGGALADAGPRADAAAACVPSERATWVVETFDAGGDYDRFAPALSGQPWVALDEHGGEVVFLELGVDHTGIVVRRRVELPDSPVYPLAFDTDGTRFALLATSGANWNGTPSLWLLDSSTGSLARAGWPEIAPDSPFTQRAAVGLVGDGVMVASVSAADDRAWVELRDGLLSVVERVEQPDALGVVAARSGPGELVVYLRTRSAPRAVLAIDAAGIEPRPDDGDAHEIIGGLEGYVVEHDHDFRIRRGERVWSGEWPHTQISPPAVLRLHGDLVAFSLQKELSGTVGYADGDALAWLDVEPRPGASGIGVAMLPVVEERRLGLFYLGLEIPRPEQPLRYFGIVCP